MTANKLILSDLVKLLTNLCKVTFFILRILLERDDNLTKPIEKIATIFPESRNGNGVPTFIFTGKKDPYPQAIAVNIYVALVGITPGKSYGFYVEVKDENQLLFAKSNLIHSFNVTDPEPAAVLRDNEVAAAANITTPVFTVQANRYYTVSVTLRNTNGQTLNTEEKPLDSKSTCFFTN